MLTNNNKGSWSNVNKHELVYSESSSNARDAPDVCLSFVLLFTIIIIVVTQKLVLQQSKNVTAKCTETLSPPPPSIQFSLRLIKFIRRIFPVSLSLLMRVIIPADLVWIQTCKCSWYHWDNFVDVCKNKFVVEGNMFLIYLWITHLYISKSWKKLETLKRL